MIFLNNVLLALELTFQLELSSNASKTAVFDLKRQGSQLPVFSTGFHYF